MAAEPGLYPRLEGGQKPLLVCVRRQVDLAHRPLAFPPPFRFGFGRHLVGSIFRYPFGGFGRTVRQPADATPDHCAALGRAHNQLLRVNVAPVLDRLQRPFLAQQFRPVFAHQFGDADPVGPFGAIRFDRPIGPAAGSWDSLQALMGVLGSYAAGGNRLGGQSETPTEIGVAVQDRSGYPTVYRQPAIEQLSAPCPPAPRWRWEGAFQATVLVVRRPPITMGASASFAWPTSNNRRVGINALLQTS
jgi:hypothetical protein